MHCNACIAQGTLFSVGHSGLMIGAGESLRTEEGGGEQQTHSFCCLATIMASLSGPKYIHKIFVIGYRAPVLASNMYISMRKSLS